MGGICRSGSAACLAQVLLEYIAWPEIEAYLERDDQLILLTRFLRTTRPPPGLGYRLPDPASYRLGCQCL